MPFWEHMLRLLGFRDSGQRTYYLDEQLVESLRLLAEREQRTEEQVAVELISAAFSRRAALDDIQVRWSTLTEREQQVTGLICRNYTNAEIAAHLYISVNTVKVHVRKALAKLGARNRAELRLLLADYDLGEEMQ